MQHLYAECVSIIPAVADLTQVDDETWELNRINVPATSRGLGHGKRLLKRVIADADAEGVALVLWVNPYGPLDRAALVQWYQRNGFKFTTDDDSFEMIRHPRP